MDCCPSILYAINHRIDQRSDEQRFFKGDRVLVLLALLHVFLLVYYEKKKKRGRKKENTSRRCIKILYSSSLAQGSLCVIPMKFRYRKFSSCLWNPRLGALHMFHSLSWIMHGCRAAVSFDQGQFCTLQSRKPFHLLAPLIWFWILRRGPSTPGSKYHSIRARR